MFSTISRCIVLTVMESTWKKHEFRSLSSSFRQYINLSLTFVENCRLTKAIIRAKKILNIQSQLEMLIGKNYYLNTSAKNGFRSYLMAYSAHSLRSVFNVHDLDLGKVAKSFGFPTPPRVDITLGASMSRDKKQGGRRAYGSQPKQAQRVKRNRYDGGRT